MRGLFISGTDTSVGKTYVTTALVSLLRSQGKTVRVRKPVATGAEWVAGRWLSEDTRLLAEAAGEVDFAKVTRWSFAAPAAPPVAARLQGATLSLDDVVDETRRCYAPGSILLVEGVGGLLCPLTEQATIADLAMALGLPLIVVARRGLGTLNHTLLTLEAARQRCLPVAGVVVNETTPLNGIAEEHNISELRRLGAPVLAVLPHAGHASALAAVDWWQLAQTSSWEPFSPCASLKEHEPSE
jgi:dethiobiotin synthetase